MSGTPGEAEGQPVQPSSLPALAVRRPVATWMATLIACTLGALSFWRLPVDLLPAFEVPSVTVFAPYPGVGSLEVESLVLEVLEEAVASVPGLATLKSTAREGAAVLQLGFRWDTDLQTALNDVRVAVERSRTLLPDDVESPSVFRFDPNQFPVIFLSVSGDADLREISRVARDDIKARLARVPGVAAVEERGLSAREVRVEVFPSRLADLDIPMEQVEQAIRAGNLDISAGKVREAGREVGLRAVSARTTLAELAQVPVASREGRVIYLEDIARVVDGTAEVDNLVRVQGRPALRLGVRKGPGENTIEVARAVREAIARLRQEFPRYRIDLIVDQSEFIESAVDGARTAAALGGLLAIAVLLLFLRSFRATLLVSVTIPASILVSFIVMDRAGVSLNLMTLGGIALGVGMLVDNAVVVLESIVHQVDRGLRGAAAAIRGASEVALAVAASTATTLVIFLPVLFLEGINRVVYGQLALVVSTSLVCSLVLSLTVVPAFAAILFRTSARSTGEEGASGWTVRLYAALLDRVLAAPRATLVALLGVALASLGLVPAIETELMPTPDEGRIEISVDLPVGTPLSRTDEVTTAVVAAVEASVPEARLVFATVGSPGWWSTRTSETARVSVRLPARAERPRSTGEVVAAIRAALPRVPDATVGVRPGGGFFLLNFLRGGSGEDRLEVQVRGTDLRAMQRHAAEVVDALKTIPGVTDVRPPKLQGRAEVVIRADPRKAGARGISAELLGRSLETYVRGRRVSRLRSADEDIPIVLRLAEEERARLDQIRALRVRSPATGEMFPLSDLATLALEEGPVVIAREEGARVLGVGAEVEGRALGEVSADVQRMLATLAPPAGVRAMLAGEAAASSSLLASLALGAALALALVYMVMAAQFESLTVPLWVMGALPFAGVGVLLLFGAGLATLNLYSFMGIIVLVGVAVNNAIVLVDYTRQLRVREGHAVALALRLACLRRLRPILMTTTTTLLGLLPVALSDADGAELQGPLAKVVVAGLLFSTMVSLVLVPALYLWIEGWREAR